jgi:hypothetical protein
LAESSQTFNPFERRKIRTTLYRLRGMTVRTLDKQHKHTTVVQHAIRQRSGVPYEIERRVCSSCREVLDEKPLRRAAA